LNGPELPSERGHDILSEGVVPGSIQVPGDGKPIVLGRDCQTTGGYPKIATVISADLDRLAQIPTGQTVRFRLVSRPDAVEAARRSAIWRDSLRAALRPVGDASDLLSHNLIGGVTKGDES
jgi:allophanate hydrolase subunit 2